MYVTVGASQSMSRMEIVKVCDGWSWSKYISDGVSQSM